MAEVTPLNALMPTSIKNPQAQKSQRPGAAAAPAAPTIKLPLVAVCTHHKTGTVWMASVFRAAKRHFRLKLHSGAQSALPDDTDIFLQDHSKVDLGELRATAARRGRSVRAIHVIRDPRDVVISGCFYHVKTTEKWANKPKPMFGGKSYREAIAAMANDHDKLVFEMENAGGKTIADMVAWDYHDSDVFEAKYEDLIDDREFQFFKPMMEFVGFKGENLAKMLEVVRDNSLFGAAAGNEHVRSGESRQWQRTFTPALRAEFEKRFPDALAKLGYQADW